MVTTVKCKCGDPVCNTYGLSDGTFYQGNGWPKERAEQYAEAINAYDKILLMKTRTLPASGRRSKVS